MSTLADALMAEITRVRDKVLPVYIEIGASGIFAATLMRAELDEATRALAEQDAIACIRLYKSLKEWHV
jgi:hypothetical protein